MASLTFTPAAPGAGTALAAGVIHLWCIPHAHAQGRSPLLALLARYLDVPAAEVVLDQDRDGKPRLAAALRELIPAARGLEFNWSHSGDFALVAIARGQPLGVDIERLGKDMRTLDVARRFFAADEAAALARLDDPRRGEAFIGLWCAKEAVLKATGRGLSFGLSRVGFERDAGNGWQLARADPELGHPREWHLRAFEPIAGYRGVLAWRGAPCRVIALVPGEFPVA